MLERLDELLFSVRKPRDVQQWLDQNKDIAHVYFGTTGFRQDTALVNDLFNRVNDKELKVLYDQAHDEFGTMDDLQEQLSEAFTRIHHDFPNFKPPKVVTMFTGFLGPDLVINDSLVVIGLDYFIGPQAKYHPPAQEFPAYILRRYRKEFLAPAIVFALSDQFNATDRQDRTLLADMVYYGKGYVFTKAMLPQTPDSLIIGYTNRQLTETYNAQEDVWAYFLDARLLYQTDPRVKSRYLSERPFTAELGPHCPGAIGRWLGWRIVGQYTDQHESRSIRTLMENPNARQIFEQSGYKGLKDAGN